MTLVCAQGSFYPANWLILADFDPNFVIREISVNQVRKYLACMLGGSGRLFMIACPALIYFVHVRFSQIFARLEWSLDCYITSYLFGTCTLEKRRYFWNNHGKIMEFDSEIWLETLTKGVLLSQGTWQTYNIIPYVDHRKATKYILYKNEFYWVALETSALHKSENP